MKIISWNVNGIRALLKKKDLFTLLKKEDPDVLCLQETKAHPEQVDILLPEYKYHFWNNPEKKGYAGLAIFSKIKPITVVTKTGDIQIDEEGRVLALEFDKFYLLDIYFPHSGRILERLPYKSKFNKAVAKYCKELTKKKPVIIASDFNVAHNDIDIKNPKQNTKNAGFTKEERAWFDSFLKEGYIDTFRELHPKEVKYTWWTYRFDARKRNIGWRIDYFVASSALKPMIKEAFVLDKVTGSDHCPVGVVLK
jgi:exodeoxyribonuclease-3